MSTEKPIYKTPGYGQTELDDTAAPTPVPIYTPAPEDSRRHLPIYKCHLRVQAARIIGVQRTGDPPLSPDVLDGLFDHIPEPPAAGRTRLVLQWDGENAAKQITGVENGQGRKLAIETVSHAFDAAEAGDYYVFYADGYASRSPAKAFEEGYTLSL
jgi:hypothetical protein